MALRIDVVEEGDDDDGRDDDHEDHDDIVIRCGGGVGGCWVDYYGINNGLFEST